MSILQVLALMYHRHQEWARRSGYAPMEWSDFKKSRMENPHSHHGVERAAAQKGGA